LDEVTKNMSFQEAVDIAKAIIKRFEKIEGKPWGVEGSIIELQKQVGELSKLVMLHEKYYFPNRDKLDKNYESDKEKIADELADILYAIIRIADQYDIDLIEAHIKARKAEDEFLKSKGV
jgi:NTP pyrophosphatase (non-canonical NTP hydrolase)